MMYGKRFHCATLHHVSVSICNTHLCTLKHKRVPTIVLSCLRTTYSQMLLFTCLLVVSADCTLLAHNNFYTREYSRVASTDNYSTRYVPVAVCAMSFLNNFCLNSVLACHTFLYYESALEWLNKRIGQRYRAYKILVRNDL